LEVAYIRNVEHDVAAILKKLKEARDDTKRVSTTTEIEGMLKKDIKQNLKGFIWGAYKNLTKTEFRMDEPYLPE
jgi:hypothetical protein